MNDVREPIQKRFIKIKKEMLDAGFAPFCEKGYYKTNAIKIVKRVGISAGALHDYFKDKEQIYITVFYDYLENISGHLLEKLSLQRPFSLANLVEDRICYYIGSYVDTSRTLTQLRTMISEDTGINHHLSNFESEYFLKIKGLLDKDDVTQDDSSKKVYTYCILVGALRQEKSAFSYNGLDFSIFKDQVTKTAIVLLSN